MVFWLDFGVHLTNHFTIARYGDAVFPYCWFLVTVVTVFCWFVFGIGLFGIVLFDAWYALRHFINGWKKGVLLYW